MANYFYKGKEARSRSDRDRDVKLLWAHTVTLKHTDINFRVTLKDVTVFSIRRKYLVCAPAHKEVGHIHRLPTGISKGNPIIFNL